MNSLLDQIKRAVKDKLIEIAIDDELPADMSALNMDIFDEVLSPYIDYFAPRRMHSALFTIDGERYYKGYFDPAEDWNGWKRPYFTKAEAERLLRAEGNVFWSNTRAERRRFTIFNIQNPDEIDHHADAEQVSTDEGEQTLYPIGAGYWIWSLYNEDGDSDSPYLQYRDTGGTDGG